METRVCPICISKQNEFENHHVIWRCEGGTDDPCNILRICNSCHALITRGNEEERKPRDFASVYYNIAIWGLDFVLKACPEPRDDDVFVALIYNQIEIHKSSRISATRFDHWLRKEFRVKYIQMIAVVLGMVSYDDRDEFLPYCGVQLRQPNNQNAGELLTPQPPTNTSKQLPLF